jgi:hypothetical protein
MCCEGNDEVGIVLRTEERSRATRSARDWKTCPRRAGPASGRANPTLYYGFSRARGCREERDRRMESGTSFFGRGG